MNSDDDDGPVELMDANINWSELGDLYLADIIEPPVNLTLAAGQSPLKAFRQNREQQHPFPEFSIVVAMSLLPEGFCYTLPNVIERDR